MVDDSWSESGHKVFLGAGSPFFPERVGGARNSSCACVLALTGSSSSPREGGVCVLLLLRDAEVEGSGGGGWEWSGARGLRGSTDGGLLGSGIQRLVDSQRRHARVCP